MKIFWGLPIFIFAFAFVNHFSKAADTQNANPFADQKLILNLQTMVQSGVISAQSVQQSQNQPSQLMLPKESQLLALIDTQCAKNGNGGAYTLKAMGLRQAVLDVQAYPLPLAAAVSIQNLSDGIEKDPCVIGVTENAVVHTQGEFTNDALFAQQTQMPAIRADEGYDFFWGSSFKITQDVIIAIVDTGVDYNHADLAASMWRNPAGQYGFDFANNDNNPMDDNVPGHGTHVAGLAAAAGGNNLGVSGVMNYHGKIMAVKSMDAAGSGTIDNIINGIRYAVTNGAQVVNCSLGGRGANAALAQVLNEAVTAGVVIVVAAGNDGEALSNANVFSPASYGAQINGMLTVGSIDTTNRGRSTFSNFAPLFVELGAPGSQGNSNTGILSTLPNSTYGALRGTSMATPIAAGATALVIGLLKTVGKTVTPAEVEKIMRESAIKTSGLATSFLDGNQLDLQQTAKYLQNSYVYTGNAGLENE